MAGWLEKSLLLGLGVLTLTRDKVREFVDNLVEAGEVEAEEAPGIVDRLVAKGEEERKAMRRVVREEMDKIRGSMPVVSRKDIEEVRRIAREEMEKIRSSVPVVSRKDVEDLSQKIDALTTQVNELAGDKTSE